jgi:hypothetical protein
MTGLDGEGMSVEAAFPPPRVNDDVPPRAFAAR